MGGMRLPPSVLIVLQPSRTLAAAIGVGALATFGIVFALPLAAWQQASLLLLVLVWAGLAWHRDALRRGRRAVRELRLAPDLVLVARCGDGRLVAGHVRTATYVGEWLTSIVWRPDGARRCRTVLILPDMMAADEFRRLRVMLRYARSGATQARPASHS
jgi:hypothetical protein